MIAHLLIILKWSCAPLYRKAHSFQVSFKEKDSRGLLKETTNGVLALHRSSSLKYFWWVISGNCNLFCPSVYEWVSVDLCKFYKTQILLFSFLLFSYPFISFPFLFIPIFLFFQCISWIRKRGWMWKHTLIWDSFPKCIFSGRSELLNGPGKV